MNNRIQLTLFVPNMAALSLEPVRRTLDPVQASLIAAHVTLCREDETNDIGPALLQERTSSSEAKPVAMHFGAPERFGEHGVLLPCVAGDVEFRALRHRLLGKAPTRAQAPHITLAHPRNPRAPGNDLLNAARLASGLCITFMRVSLIRQEGSGRWQVLQDFALGSRASSAGAPLYQDLCARRENDLDLGLA